MDIPSGSVLSRISESERIHEGAKEIVKDQLEILESARSGKAEYRTGMPEIYDGENPTRSKGCLSQAWSVGELLRVYEVIEKG